MSLLPAISLPRKACYNRLTSSFYPFSLTLLGRCQGIKLPNFNDTMSGTKRPWPCNAMECPPCCKINSARRCPECTALARLAHIQCQNADCNLSFRANPPMGFKKTIAEVERLVSVGRGRPSLHRCHHTPLLCVCVAALDHDAAGRTSNPARVLWIPTVGGGPVHPAWEKLRSGCQMWAQRE